MARDTHSRGRLLNKFKIDKDRRISIDFTVPNRKTETEDRHVIESDDPPKESLIKAFDQLKEAAIECAELPSTWEEHLTVRGVTITHKNGVTGAVITVLRDLEDSASPLVLNTPHKTVESYNEFDEDCIGLLSAHVQGLLESLEQEVWKYVDGERSQGELFSYEDEDTAEADIDAFMQEGGLQHHG